MARSDRGARLGAHPRDHLVEHQRDDEHALGIVEMRDRDDRDARLALGREQQALRIERLALIQVAKPGEAMRLFSCIASLRRSFAGKNVSRSKAPSLSKGGFCTAWISAGHVERHALRARRPRGCSRAGCARASRSGSASMPSRLSRPDTTEPTRSRSAPRVGQQLAARGGANERSTDSGRPVSAPGV